jgi:hypothetical protein
MTKKAYKLLQLTNQDIGAVDANSALPLGLVTRRINAPYTNCNTFVLSSGGTNTITITEPGFYKITYSASFTAGAAGNISASLVTDGTTVYTATETAADVGSIVNITLPYTIRVTCSAPATLPTTVQIVLGDVAITGTTSNLIIEQVQ